MAQHKFTELTDAVKKAKEMVEKIRSSINTEYLGLRIIKSLDGGMKGERVVYYIEDQEESGFVRNWESEVFSYGRDGFDPKSTQTRNYNKARKQLSQLTSDHE